MARAAAAAGEPTPFYVLDLDGVGQRFVAMRDAWRQRFGDGVTIAYSYKTNGLPILTRHLRGLGAAAEVVSGTELDWAIADGHQGRDIYFDGPVKAAEELRSALAIGARIQLDSIDELVGLRAALVGHRGPAPRFSARLALPHPETGVSRFGLLTHELAVLAHELDSLGLHLDGVHVHSGTRHDTAETLSRLAAMAAPSIRLLQQQQQTVILDLGGGFPGTDGTAPPGDLAYATATWRALEATGVDLDRLRIVLEPGRSLTERFGIAVFRVAARKLRGGTSLLVLDGGGNLVGMGAAVAEDVIIEAEGPRAARHHVFGAHCFERDIVALDVEGPTDIPLGSVVLVEGVGAYALNTAAAWIRPLPAVLVLVDGDLRRAREAQRGLDLRARDASPEHEFTP